MASIWIPPSRKIGRVTDAQPGTAVWAANLAHKTQAETARLPKKMANPVSVTHRSGTTERLVTASSASASIFSGGYLQIPAARGRRTNCTMAVRRPRSGTSPRT